MAARLLVDGPGGLRSIALSAMLHEIGRHRRCAVRLEGEQVASVHARLVRERQGGYFLLDAGTSAGTRVNGERIVRYGPLTGRDVVHIGRHTLRLLETPQDPEPGLAGAPRPPAVPVPGVPASGAALLACHAEPVHRALLEALDLRRHDVTRLSDAELRTLTARLIDDILAARAWPPELDVQQLRQFVLDEAVGLGPLENLLRDEGVTEVMVNGISDVFVERAGRLHRTPVAFSSARALSTVIERIVASAGRRIDESSPMVDTRLEDGSRVNVVIPPLTLKGPAITIRRFARRALTPEDLIGCGSLSPEMLEFLRVCVVQRRNLIVSGGTGTGKTTLLNVLSNLIPPDERLVTIEDAAELRLHHENLVALEARPVNLEGRGQVSIRELVRNALRMRPDRIVVGECRGGEALDMLQAMNTGHEGSLTTAHANSPRDLLSRLEVMVLMAGFELPVMAIREQIAAAVDVIVQQARFPCGARRITRIVEVTGMEAGTIQTQDLFAFQRQGYDCEGRTLGRFVACGCVPTFYEELRHDGVEVSVAPFHSGPPIHPGHTP
ncbi:MAG: Flp pilus assembly complex ATPase component TadA [Gammaproteobacteria bacterium]|nr:Flp pilus assembly complex ATPase component TadA [Gammaproteobacteria bacterium]